MPESNTQSPGLSGKRVTLWLAITMLVVGAVLGYTLWVYSEFDKARGETAAAWRSLTVELDKRYQEVDRQMQASAGESTDRERFAEQLRLGLDGFRTTAQVNRQKTEAESLESLFSTGAASAGLLLSSPPELEELVSAFNQRLQTEREILSSPGGRILDIFLEFPQPPQFELAR